MITTEPKSLKQLLNESVDLECEVEILPIMPVNPRNVLSEMLALLPKSKAPYKSRL
jgi:hypothetical protein